MKTKERKRTEAIERQSAYDKLTVTQKISLVKKRGGSVKELKKLNALKNTKKKSKKKEDINTSK